MATTCNSWTCPMCTVALTTAYCPTCGERRPQARDLTLPGLLRLLYKSFSHVDGKLFRSLRLLVIRPGFLTQAYAQGRRQSYIGPFALFFSVNALFFVTQSLMSVNIFSTPLDSHLHGQDWSALANSLVAQRLDATQSSLQRFAPLFDQAVALNAKSLIVLMALVFSVLLPLAFHQSRSPVVVHVAFSLHLYAFLLLLFCVLSAVAAVDVLFGGAGLKSARMDNILTAINLAACATYLYLATGTVYGARGAGRVFKVAALTLAVGAIVLGYRFALLLITLYTTSA
ncbi:MAG: DUF3667 domain-containing protein [Burkholderiales bacterium]